MPKIPPGPLTGKEPDGETVLAVITKNEREEIVVKASIFNGYPVISLRIRFRGKDGELHYTREGVALKPGEQTDAAMKAMAEGQKRFGVGAPPVTSPSPTEPVATAAPVAGVPNGVVREPQSETARLMLKNNPRLTLEQINADRVTRGLEPLN